MLTLYFKAGDIVIIEYMQKTFTVLNESFKFQNCSGGLKLPRHFSLERRLERFVIIYIPKIWEGLITVYTGKVFPTPSWSDRDERCKITSPKSRSLLGRRAQYSFE